MASVPWSQWCFLSFIRILDSGQEANNQIRIEYDEGGGATQATLQLTAGVYPFGVNGNGDEDSLEVGAWNGDPTDVELFGVNSLLREVAQEITQELTTNSVNMGLETIASIEGNQVASGKIIVRMDGSSTDYVKFLWTHADTTVDPAWFGIAKTSGAYPTSSDCYGNQSTVISQMSSNLALVGQKVLGAEPIEEGYLEVGVVAGNGAGRWKRFGSGYEQISAFDVKVEGLPRDSVDSGFHSLRRWAQALVFNRARKRFIYVPDLAKPTGADYPREWDPDDTSENRRWGWRDLMIDGLRGFAFENIRHLSNSNRMWRLSTPVRKYVA